MHTDIRKKLQPLTYKGNGPMSQTQPSNQEPQKQALSDKPTPQSHPAATGNGPVNQSAPRILDDFALRSRRMEEALEDIATHCNQFAKSLRKASQEFSQDILDMLGKIK